MRPGTCYAPTPGSDPDIVAATAVLPNPLGTAPVLLGATPRVCVPLGGIRDVQVRGSFTLPADLSVSVPITIQASLTLAPVGGQAGSPSAYPPGSYGGYPGTGAYGSPSTYGGAYPGSPSSSSSPRSLRSPSLSPPSTSGPGSGLPPVASPPGGTNQPRTVPFEAAAPAVPVASFQMLATFLLGFTLLALL